MHYFADEAVQPTPGDRGKTTRRKSTRTVRGCEGQWIAQVKEELKDRPTGWLVRYELAWEPRSWETVGRVVASTHGRFDTEEQATAAAAALPVGPETRYVGHNGTNTRTRVWVEREVK